MESQQTSEQIRITPHPRTLRKAREQVKLMVQDGFSNSRIKSYLRRHCQWWVNTAESWNYQQLLNWFIDVCWDKTIASIVRSMIATSEINAASLVQAPVVVEPLIPL